MAEQISEAAKQEARVLAQQYAELQGTEYVDPYPETPAPETPETPKEDEVSDEQLLALLKKRNISVSSLDELIPQPTEEELATAAAKRESEMLAYGLGTGKFKKEDYDAYQLAQANKIGVIKDELVTEMTEMFPDLSEEAILEKIAQYTFEHLDETDPMRLRREKELLAQAESKIKDKYKNIANLANDYDQHLQGLTNKTNNEQKVQAALPVYKADLSVALESLKGLTVSVNDTKNPANDIQIPLSISDTNLEELRDAFMQTDIILGKVKTGYSQEQLQGEVLAAFKLQHWSRLVSQAAKDYNSIQKESYIRGVKGLKSELNPDIASDNLDTNPNNALYQDLIDNGTSNVPKQNA